MFGIARRLAWDEPALTLTCSPAQKQTERCHPAETRPLTTREYARVQTFPDSWSFAGGTSSVYRQIERMGYLQFDTIRTVERAHHHILYSRFDDYQPRMLTKLLEKDRDLRYQSAREVLADLKRLRRDTESSHSVTVPTPAAEPASKGKAVALLIAAVVIAVACKKSHTFATQKLSSNLSTNNITCPQFRDAEAVGLASELLLAACARLGLAEPGAGLGDGAVGTHADLFARRAVVAGLHACEQIALKHQI